MVRRDRVQQVQGKRSARVSRTGLALAVIGLVLCLGSTGWAGIGQAKRPFRSSTVQQQQRHRTTASRFRAFRFKTRASHRFRTRFQAFQPRTRAFSNRHGHHANRVKVVRNHRFHFSSPSQSQTVKIYRATRR